MPEFNIFDYVDTFFMQAKVMIKIQLFAFYTAFHIGKKHFFMKFEVAQPDLKK